MRANGTKPADMTDAQWQWVEGYAEGHKEGYRAAVWAMQEGLLGVTTVTVGETSYSEPIAVKHELRAQKSFQPANPAHDVICWQCNGYPYNSGQMCPVCVGAGTLRVAQPIPVEGPGPHVFKVACERCKTRGTINVWKSDDSYDSWTEPVECPDCKGKGFV